MKKEEDETNEERKDFAIDKLKAIDILLAAVAALIVAARAIIKLIGYMNKMNPEMA